MKQRVGIVIAAKTGMSVRICRMCMVCRAPSSDVLSFSAVTPRAA